MYFLSDFSIYVHCQVSNFNFSYSPCQIGRKTIVASSFSEVEQTIKPSGPGCYFQGHTSNGQLSFYNGYLFVLVFCFFLSNFQNLCFLENYLFSPNFKIYYIMFIIFFYDLKYLLYLCFYIIIMCVYIFSWYILEFSIYFLVKNYLLFLYIFYNILFSSASISAFLLYSIFFM